MGLKPKAGYDRKIRNSHDRHRKRTFFLSVEGNNKTEKIYFRAFARDHDSVIIRFSDGNATDPVNMVNELVNYLQGRMDRDYGDAAYCLIDADCDERKDNQIASADRIAKKNRINIIMSGPCFEIWLLCHFNKKAPQYLNNDAVTHEVQRYILQYTKSYSDTFEETKDNIDTAIQNAKELEKHCLSAGLTPHKVSFAPSTEIYKLIEDLLRYE